MQSDQIAIFGKRQLPAMLRNQAQGRVRPSPIISTIVAHLNSHLSHSSPCPEPSHNTQVSNWPLAAIPTIYFLDLRLVLNSCPFTSTSRYHISPLFLNLTLTRNNMRFSTAFVLLSLFMTGSQVVATPLVNIFWLLALPFTRLIQFLNTTVLWRQHR